MGCQTTEIKGFLVVVENNLLGGSEDAQAACLRCKHPGNRTWIFFLAVST